VRALENFRAKIFRSSVPPVNLSVSCNRENPAAASAIEGKSQSYEHGKKSVGWEKCIQTKERNRQNSSCSELHGVFAPPKSIAQAPVVAIHDSELTEQLETMPASPPTPTGGGATGLSMVATDWHYFVMPESMQEALRSDGTAFTVIGDSNITADVAAEWFAEVSDRDQPASEAIRG